MKMAELADLNVNEIRSAASIEFVVSQSDRGDVVMTFKHPKLSGGYRDVKIKGSKLSSVNHPTAYLKKIASVKNEELVREIATVGDYPDVREWAFDTFTDLRGKLFNGESIPGWVWPRWSKAHLGMRAVVDGGVVPIEEGEEKVARKIVRAKTPVDPKKVKRPFCPVHTESQMKFDKITNVWVCSVEGCDIKGRPKQDTDNGQVILGKGNTTMRVVCEEGESPAIILISDDNVALDVTELVSLSEIYDSFDLATQLERAVKHGNTMISVPVSHTVKVPLRLTVTKPEFFKI